jgi:ribosomal protein L36
VCLRLTWGYRNETSSRFSLWHFHPNRKIVERRGVLRVTRKRHNQRDFAEVFSLAFPPLCGALSAPFGRECAKVRRCCAPAVTQKLGIFDALFIACMSFTEPACPLRYRHNTIYFTSLVSARTTTKRDLIDFSPLQMGAALKVPNSCVTAGAAGTCGLQAHHPEVGAESAQPQRTKKYMYE